MRTEKWNMYLDSLQGHPSVCQSSHTVEGFNFLKELIPPKEFPRMLNIGAGEGLETKILYDLGYKPVGIIRGNSNVKFAKKNYGNLDILFLDQDMHDIPFKSNSFDSIFMNHSFEHAYAPFILLLELYCVLRLGGRMWIAMPDFKEITDETIESASKISHHHPNILCKNLFTQFFQTTGFKILQNNGNNYLLEKQDIQYVHDDVKSTVLKRKILYG